MNASLTITQHNVKSVNWNYCCDHQIYPPSKTTAFGRLSQLQLMNLSPETLPKSEMKTIGYCLVNTTFLCVQYLFLVKDSFLHKRCIAFMFVVKSLKKTYWSFTNNGYRRLRNVRKCQQNVTTPCLRKWGKKINPTMLNIACILILS